MSRLLKIVLIFLAFSLQSSVLSSAALAADHPLRPYPFQLTQEEQQKQFTPNDPNLTPYCASRPTLVKTIEVDQRESAAEINFSGTLNANFSSFTTPLLSITDNSNPDFNLPYSEKAKRYLADYLEGRAYYEGMAEPENPTFEQQNDLYNRLGAFRKLAPQSYQDKLKIALIKRAAGQLTQTQAEKYYGFKPASLTIHNYIVANWNGQRVVNQNQGFAVRLTDFLNHLPPLAENYQDSSQYQTDYQTWTKTDNQKWSKLWPYVPMFSREDTKGFIQSIPEPGQQNDTITTQEVIHPHLARTYEVSSAISNLLAPQSTQQYEPPSFSSFYTPAPWATDPWWLESGQNIPAGLDPLCQPPTIASSGDLAKNSGFSSVINKSELIEQEPSSDCEITEEDALTGNPVVVNDTNCFKEQQIRFSPTYYKTYTPFLNQIAFNLSAGPGALFGMFKTDDQQPVDIAATTADKNPGYSYSEGEVETGTKPKFFYKALGFIHCQKEKLLATLQPFISNQPYQYFSPKCTTLTSLTGTLSGLAGECPEGGEEITSLLASQMLNGIVKLLPNTVTTRSMSRRKCITPTMIIIHWSGGWDNDLGTDRTFGTLITRNLSCQLASDTNDTILMQPFYKTQVELPWCAGLERNLLSIQTELSGGLVPSRGHPYYGKLDIRFTDESGNPPRIGNPNKPSQKIFPEKAVVDHAVSSVCVIMKQYNIPWTQIYGHHYTPGGRDGEPGKNFFDNWFLPRVINECH